MKRSENLPCTRRLGYENHGRRPQSTRTRELLASPAASLHLPYCPSYNAKKELCQNTDTAPFSEFKVQLASYFATTFTTVDVPSV